MSITEKTETTSYPSHKAQLLSDGYIDHITGPRCLVQMKEGPNNGLYQIVHADEILPKGQDVLVNWRNRAARI